MIHLILWLDSDAKRLQKALKFKNLKMEFALKFVINSVSRDNTSENQLKFSVITTYHRLVTPHKSKAWIGCFMKHIEEVVY